MHAITHFSSEASTRHTARVRKTAMRKGTKLMIERGIVARHVRCQDV